MYPYGNVRVQRWHNRSKLTSLFFPRICAGSYYRYVLNLVLAVRIERVVLIILSHWAERNFRCYPLSFSAGSSKIKIRTSSPYNANLALYGDEVRILIFDDPAELEMGERPVMVRSGRGPFRPARARHARAMHEFFFENLQNPAPDRRAGAMHQFCSGQLNSSHQSEPRSACVSGYGRLVLYGVPN
jgi:hypothetical protein